VTEHIALALEPFRFSGGPLIECATLESGPPGIENQAHVDGTTARLIEYFDSHPQHRAADAVVLACFSDPGLHAMREVLPCPVWGSAECAYLSAAARVERFGVLSILSRSIPRHKRQVRLLGLEHRLAEDLAIEIGVVGLSDEAVTFARMREVGSTLKERHGAQAVIMGCAGMARYRSRLEDALGVPVIDPTQAAVAMALGTLLASRGAG
jgi:Asp/Glu/hydantoin racemase